MQERGTDWILKLNELWSEWEHRSRTSSLPRLIWVNSVTELVGFEKKSRSCLALVADDSDEAWIIAMAPAPLRETGGGWLSQPHIAAAEDRLIYSFGTESCKSLLSVGMKNARDLFLRCITEEY